MSWAARAFRTDEFCAVPVMMLARSEQGGAAAPYLVAGALLGVPDLLKIIFTLPALPISVGSRAG